MGHLVELRRLLTLGIFGDNAAITVNEVDTVQI